ncbi:SDR family oxidoreductase [Alicyclobacillus fodiniaquatilis]|uniref:SDR family oxidoreductase n=1 Tax=Alicyclobacillus fodiniaquatilis TaxID=1661150 RepID=A0ABW4JC96_9BACL
MKVLFIGGTGVISQAVSRLAVERGVELFLLNRGKRSAFVPKGATVIQGDIRDVQATKEALGNQRFDVIVDWIGFTPAQAQVDIELFQAKTDQYIYISSASVYQKPLTHPIVTESTPLSNPYWQYSRDKIASEALLMDAYRSTGFPVTIVRPSFTYGDTLIPAAMNSGAHPWSLVERMRQGKGIIVHGDGTSLWTMTHNTDFAKGFVGLMGNPQAIGHAFHITSDEVLTWDQIYQAIGKAAGVAPKLVHISTDFIARCVPEKSAGLLGDKAVSHIFDNSKIKRFVPEYQSTVPFAAGIRQTIAWFEAHPEQCLVDEAWNAQMDAIILAHEAGAAHFSSEMNG